MINRSRSREDQEQRSRTPIFKDSLSRTREAPPNTPESLAFSDSPLTPIPGAIPTCKTRIRVQPTLTHTPANGLDFRAHSLVTFPLPRRTNVSGVSSQAPRAGMVPNDGAPVCCGDWHTRGTLTVGGSGSAPPRIPTRGHLAHSLIALTHHHGCWARVAGSSEEFRTVLAIHLANVTDENELTRSSLTCIRDR